jgi:hypothetical protein
MAGRKVSESQTLYPLAEVPAFWEVAAKVYDYNPETGVFTVRMDAPNVKRFRLGMPAARSLSNEGYQRLSVSHSGRRDVVSGHRLAWYLMKGENPDCPLDHRNGNRCDNRWENLRIATYQQNAFNRSGVQGHDFSKGVEPSTEGKTWRARIGVDGGMVHLGTYATEAEACAAYQGAAHIIQGEYRRAA